MIKKMMHMVLFWVVFQVLVPLDRLLAGLMAETTDGRRVVTAKRRGTQSLAARRTYFAPMRSSNWGELLLPVLYNFFEVGRALRPTLREQMYMVMGSDRSKEENMGLGGIGTDAWDDYEMSGRKGMLDFDKGYLATYVHKEYPVTFEIERKLRDDDQYGVVAGTRARKMGISAEQKMERDAVSVFNNAFDTNFAGPDGKPLVSTTHPKNGNKTGNLSNKGTDALSVENVEAARIAMETTPDDAGNILGMVPDTILVPPGLRNTALQISGSELNPTDANNAINPEAGYRVVVWPYLTDSNNWFLIDSVWMRESLKWYDRVPLQITLLSQSSTEVAYEAYMRYSFGWDDWRWVYGNEVA